MHAPRLVAPTLAVLSLVAFLSACRAERERDRSAAEGNAAPRSVQSQAGGPIPDDFPKSIPIYPGAKTQAVARSDGPRGKASWSVTLETGDAKDRVDAYYAQNMAGFVADPNLRSTLQAGDTSMSVWRSPQYDVTLLVGVDAAQKTTISLAVSQR
jgi:hypothetical protein